MSVRNRLIEAIILFAGAVAANIAVAVIRVTAEPVTTSSQFFVEIVEHDITEEGRERTACGVPSFYRSNQTISQCPGIQECSAKLDYAFMVSGDARHQDVAVNSVEKSFQIEINHYVVAIGDVTLCVGFGLVADAPADIRNCAPKTSDPIALGELAARLVESGGRRHRGRRVS